ncbi:hypothetical protein Sgou_24470 [Streptomyces gougerotii]|uniref:Uncharacterized protein n=2 Tax=Streptomyces diastaticus group TaxID=2849069 RepID=A0A8H9HQV3_9ACTN|nr:hypothetical protein Srut_11300 [Streptomyces rutgersensis]GFH77777.1 hypothetical protein Sgou_24470 [Streptomyces gougerotii]GGU15745.1 hypothetical protein GCM10015534_18070 [Streptomyces diastaticus subsp. diastaticus]GGU82356.1 hypothetical protein GCM10010227_40920 [Streptomyces gougerotii]
MAWSPPESLNPRARPPGAVRRRGLRAGFRTVAGGLAAGSPLGEPFPRVEESPRLRPAGYQLPLPEDGKNFLTT